MCGRGPATRSASTLHRCAVARRITAQSAISHGHARARWLVGVDTLVTVIDATAIRGAITRQSAFGLHGDRHSRPASYYCRPHYKSPSIAVSAGNATIEGEGIALHSAKGVTIETGIEDATPP